MASLKTSLVFFTHLQAQGGSKCSLGLKFVSLLTIICILWCFPSLIILKTGATCGCICTCCWIYGLLGEYVLKIFGFTWLPLFFSSKVPCFHITLLDILICSGLILCLFHHPVGFRVFSFVCLLTCTLDLLKSFGFLSAIIVFQQFVFFPL